MPTLAEIPERRAKHCVADLKRPHGEGHNKVCICRCLWCAVERREITDATARALYWTFRDVRV